MRLSGLTILIGLMVSLVMATSISAKPRTFHELVDAYFEDYFKANPSQATSVGFHQYDHQLEDFSLAAHQRNRRKLLAYLKEFQAINPRPLSQNDRDDREIMIASIQSSLLEEDRVQMWRKNPDGYSGGSHRQHLHAHQTQFRARRGTPALSHRARETNSARALAGA